MIVHVQNINIWSTQVWKFAIFEYATYARTRFVKPCRRIRIDSLQASTEQSVTKNGWWSEHRRKRNTERYCSGYRWWGVFEPFSSGTFDGDKSCNVSRVDQVVQPFPPWRTLLQDSKRSYGSRSSSIVRSVSIRQAYSIPRNVYRRSNAYILERL